MHARILVALLSLSACVQRPLAIALYDERAGDLEPQPELTDEVLEACEILDVDCYPATADDLGVVRLFLLPAPDDIAGRSLKNWGCKRLAWADPDDPVVIAHEIGHTLRLSHVDDPANLMWHSARMRGLTDKQRNKIDRNLSNLWSCP